MNFYESDIAKAMKASFGKGTSPTRRDVFTMLVQISGQSRTPEAVLHVTQNMNDRTFTLGETAAMLANSMTQLLWEATFMFRGVSIFVEDRQLIEAMQRTNIEALIKDVRLPFPVIEIVFPSGVKLRTDGLELSGCLLIDSRGIDIKKEWSPFGDVNVVDPGAGSGFERDRLLFFTRLVNNNGDRDREGVSWLRMSPLQTLSELPVRVKMSDRDHDGLNEMAQIAFGLCLYLQTSEGLRALQPRVTHENRPFMSPIVGRLLKKRPRYVIRDLITKKFGPSESHGGHHAGPKAHWRRLHMRALAHERYHRNENGSVRVIWVRPALVNASADDATRETRRV